jgi:threonine/homoserine/homoserine lactone efflux protein
MFLALIVGIAFGFVGSMPPAGPIAVLVFARGLSGQHRSGLAIAGGAAVAEGGYAFLAYWGTGELVSRFPAALLASKGAATLILLGLGVYCLVARPTFGPSEPSAPPVQSSVALGLGITALNPTFLATWTAAVTVLHSTGFVPASVAAAGPFALGAAVGIYLWFWVLLVLMRRYAGALRPAAVGWALRAIGLALLAMGAWEAAGFIRIV